MTTLDFFPLSYPTGSTLIELPQESTDYKTIEAGSTVVREREETVEIDIDMRRLTNKRDKSKNAYSIKELKNIAKALGIKGASGMNKENLVKYIKLKLKK